MKFQDLPKSQMAARMAKYIMEDTLEVLKEDQQAGDYLIITSPGAAGYLMRGCRLYHERSWVGAWVDLSLSW